MPSGRRLVGRRLGLLLLGGRLPGLAVGGGPAALVGQPQAFQRRVAGADALVGAVREAGYDVAS